MYFLLVQHLLHKLATKHENLGYFHSHPVHVRKSLAAAPFAACPSDLAQVNGHHHANPTLQEQLAAISWTIRIIDITLRSSVDWLLHWSYNIDVTTLGPRCHKGVLNLGCEE